MGDLVLNRCLGRDTTPANRTELPIAARSVFECEKEECSRLKLPFRITPTYTARRPQAAKYFKYEPFLGFQDQPA
jgi:hypothetical protein